jgi:hypothetical protein
MCATGIFAQDIDSADLAILQKHEIKLLHYFDSLKSVENADTRLNLNKQILTIFDQALNHHASFHYPFDTLKNVGRLLSNDELLKIYTWNVPLRFGEHKYFGYIQRYDKKEDTTYLYQLQDQEISGKPRLFKEYTPGNWYGALYYEIVEEKIKGEKIYTLLGYDFNDILSSYKIIDILIFLDNQPIIGAPMFVYKNKKQYRVLFEYSSRVSMALTYNDNLKMITFDHLAPFEPGMEGNYQFYGPDSSYDGFEFEDNLWMHRSDVDARNR